MFYNRFAVLGTIHDIDQRNSGAAMIFVRSSSREEAEVNGSPVPSWFSPILAMRVPKHIVERVQPELLVKDAVVSVEGRMQGMRRNVEGRDFYFVEALVTSLRAPD